MESRIYNLELASERQLYSQGHKINKNYSDLTTREKISRCKQNTTSLIIVGCRHKCWGKRTHGEKVI
jgi:hypothetical protein